MKNSTNPNHIQKSESSSLLLFIPAGQRSTSAANVGCCGVSICGMLLNIVTVTKEAECHLQQQTQTHCNCSDYTIQKSKPRCSPAHASFSPPYLLYPSLEICPGPLLSKTT